MTDEERIEQLRRTAETAYRLYQLASGRFDRVVETILTEAAHGDTTVRQLVDCAAEIAMNCDSWDPTLQDLYDRAVTNYPRDPIIRGPR